MNNRDMVMICAYAPTESGNWEAKDAFYEELERVPYYALPGHCIKLLLGDAKIVTLTIELCEVRKKFYST